MGHPVDSPCSLRMTIICELVPHPSFPPQPANSAQAGDADSLGWARGIGALPHPWCLAKVRTRVLVPFQAIWTPMQSSRKAMTRTTPCAVWGEILRVMRGA